MRIGSLNRSNTSSQMEHFISLFSTHTSNPLQIKIRCVTIRFEVKCVALLTDHFFMQYKNHEREKIYVHTLLLSTWTIDQLRLGASKKEQEVFVCVKCHSEFTVRNSCSHTAEYRF